MWINSSFAADNLALALLGSWTNIAFIQKVFRRHVLVKTINKKCHILSPDCQPVPAHLVCSHSFWFELFPIWSDERAQWHFLIASLTLMISIAAYYLHPYELQSLFTISILPLLFFMIIFVSTAVLFIFIWNAACQVFADSHKSRQFNLSFSSSVI